MATQDAVDDRLKQAVANWQTAWQDNESRWVYTRQDKLKDAPPPDTS